MTRTVLRMFKRLKVAQFCRNYLRPSIAIDTLPLSSKELFGRFAQASCASVLRDSNGWSMRVMLPS